MIFNNLTLQRIDVSFLSRYDIMLSCWRVTPETRPLFDELEKSLSRLLDTNVAEHYVSLNEPYLKANVEKYDGGREDFIALMRAPDVQAPSPPTVDSNEIVVEIHQQPSTSATIPIDPSTNRHSSSSQIE